MKAILELNAEEVKEAIVRHLMTKNIRAGNIDLVCEKQYEDFPGGGHEIVFSKAKVDVEIGD